MPEIGIIETIFRAKAEAATAARPLWAGQSYRPSSGTEGMAFDDNWCAHCAQDAEWRDDPDNVDPARSCQILSATFIYDISDPNYPKEWIYGEDGRPRCTAFTTTTDETPRCEQTIDMGF